MNKAAFSFFKWLGVVIAAIAAGVSVILGSVEDVPMQYIMFYGLAIFALIVWGWHQLSVNWVYRDAAGPARRDAAETGYLRALIVNNKAGVIALLILAAIFIAVAFIMDDFFQWRTLLSALVFAALLIITYLINRYGADNKSVLIGLTVLIGLFVIGSLSVEGFLSTLNLKSMLVFAAFLGLACIGQTLVVLLGGLDLSIPFVIGSSNIGLMYLLTLGVPPWLAFIAVIVCGGAIGLANGFLSFRLQGQALILTLGTGFAVSGGTQILTSIGTAFGGNVFGTVPGWLSNLASINGVFFGLNFPPVVIVWILASIILIVGSRTTTWGRSLYALGGSRTASARLSISEQAYWVGAYAISGAVSALTGSLLLGWSGGGFIGVGDQYLFMTLAAVVVGGTSLLGGRGGYGFTVIGVLVLQVLTSFLVGIGLPYEGQQFVFGLLILPMVALYARSAHIRTQI